MRCPSCNKFPSFDPADPEVEVEAENGMVTGTVRLVLNTQCCGDEVKEANFDVEIDLTDELTDALKAAGIENPDLEGDGVRYDVEPDASVGDRYENKDRNGKPITNSRYMKHYWCVDMTVEVTCTYPASEAEPVTVTVTHEWHDEIQASAMDELV